MKNENMDELIMKLTDLEISARVMAAGLESLCQEEGSRCLAVIANQLEKIVESMDFS